MKVFTFRYQKGIRKKVLSEMKEVMRTGRPKVHNNEMLCDSVESLLQCISKSRMEAFLAIIEHKPESVYELAQALGKDQANVLKDAKALEGMGLIELKPVKDGNRERLKPKPLFDAVVVEMGQQSVEEAPPRKKAV